MLSTAKSSLEEMLEDLRRREEDEAPKDMPPALPPRPKPTSRARPPSTKRHLPTGLEVDESGPAQSTSDSYLKKGEKEGERLRNFGPKKVKEMEPGESPYVVVASNENEQDQRLEWDDKVGYFIKKVENVVWLSFWIVDSYCKSFLRDFCFSVLCV